jgi:16S rRNA (guanine(966)-N(2))-methyltransferase RsmD
MNAARRSSKRRSPANKPAGRVRIVGGLWRSRVIDVPERPDLRPTPNRVRETLFNWLGQELAGLACLDLYAGSGALGFEAASRGAARVVMVEQDRVALRALEKNRAALDAKQVEIVPGDALAYLARPAAALRFDVVFLDPPFRQNVFPDLMRGLAKRLAPGARVYVEAAAPLETEPPWRELKRRRAGQVSYQLLRWEGDEQSHQGGISGNV